MLSVLRNFPRICVIEVKVLQYPSRSTKMQGKNLLNMNMLLRAIRGRFQIQRFLDIFSLSKLLLHIFAEGSIKDF
jgi:hypothetical protein